MTREDLWSSRGHKSGKRWLYRVRDRNLRRYISETFDDEKVGEAWARKTHARLELGLDSAERARVAVVGAEYVQSLKDRDPPCHPHVLLRAHMVLRELEAAGVRDMKAPGFRAQVEHYLRNIPVGRTRGNTGKMAISTKLQRLNFVRNLVNQAQRRGYILRNPIHDLNPFTLPDSPRETFTLEEYRALAALDMPHNQDWLWGMVLIYTGLRRGESLSLEWQDIKWKQRVLRVRKGKGNKARAVPMMDELYSLLSPIGGPDASVARMGPVITDIIPRHKQMWKAFRRFIALGGIKPERGIDALTGIPICLSPHCCRHSYAALQLATGTDSMYLKMAMGHSQDDMTEHYARQVSSYRRQVEVEDWEAGQFYLKREPPKPSEENQDVLTD